MVTVAARRAGVRYFQRVWKLSERRACHLASLGRSTARYQSRRPDDAPLRTQLLALAHQHPRYGYRRLHALLRRAGWRVNRKRVERLYRMAGLVVRRSRRKRPAARVMQVLQRLIIQRGRPGGIVLDNGPEFTAHAFLRWATQTGITLDFIEPGKPVENAFVESFNGKFRDECLNQHWFLDLTDARRTIEAWRQHYNEQRPHSALGYQTPQAVAIQAAGLSQ